MVCEATGHGVDDEELIVTTLGLRSSSEIVEGRGGGKAKIKLGGPLGGKGSTKR